MKLLFIVMIAVFFIIILIKAFLHYPSYKSSIYHSLYSIYLEYFFRYEIRKDCSKSSWLQSQIGTHHLFFSQITDNNGKVINHFVTILCNSGITIVSFLNPNGTINGKIKDNHWIVTRKEDNKSKSFRIINPINSLQQYKDCISKRLNYDTISCIIAISNTSNINNLEADKIKILHYEDIINYLKETKQNIPILSATQIDDLFHKL